MGFIAGVLAFGLAACGRNEPASTAANAPEASGEAGAAAPDAAKGGMEGMDHSQHMMTAEQFAELRQKIPLYAVFTDEQIMENMGRMPPDFWSVISGPEMKSNIGVLALGHGYTLGGNEQFENYAGPIAKEYPTAVAPGMAMMSSSHIQQALDELTTKHGVKTIVVVPMEPGDDSSLHRQWEYIFGLEDEAPYLTVPRVKTDARIVFTKSPAEDPRVAMIMKDYAVETSANPGKDRLIIVSHGPEDPKDQADELKLLGEHADRIRAASKFTDIKAASLQDDAIPEIRAANVAELRRLIKEATDQGREAVIVPLILTKGGFHRRLQKDLDGLTYKFANRGLIEHPLFQEWVSTTVREASAGS
jgi:sirohydrochlorin ferrochelatase